MVVWLQDSNALCIRQRNKTACAALSFPTGLSLLTMTPADPWLFFSQMQNHSERNHSAVEKEAHAIVEAVCKWRHYLSGRHFTLITDQKSVSFMFHTMHKSNIKNGKIMRWRLELADYSFDIQY